MVKLIKPINFNQNYHYFSIFIKYNQNQRNKMVKLIKQSNIIKNTIISLFLMHFNQNNQINWKYYFLYIYKAINFSYINIILVIKSNNNLITYKGINFLF